MINKKILITTKNISNFKPIFKIYKQSLTIETNGSD